MRSIYLIEIMYICNSTFICRTLQILSLMAISTSTDWSLASTKCCRRTHVHTFMHTCQFPSFHPFSSAKSRFLPVKFSKPPSPILEEESPNTPIVQLDLNFADAQQYSKLDTENLNDFICGLLDDRRTEALGCEYYQRLKERPEFRPEKPTLRLLIRYLLRLKKWDFIQSVLEDLMVYHVLPDRFTCSKMISVCIKSRKFKISDTLLEIFQSDGEVAVLAFDSAMKSYNRLHMYRSTVSVYERMKNANVVGDSRCCFHIMEAYLRIGDCEKVLELFHEFQSRKSFGSTRYLPKIYEILFESLSESGRAFEALEHFRELTKREGLEDSIYSKLICSFAKLGEVDMAEEVLSEAKSKTTLREPELYMKLVLMYVEEGSLEKTLEVVEAMKEANVRVSDCVLCAIVNGFSKRRGFRAAIQVFEQLVSQGYEPGQVTYASIINAYCRLGKYTKAEKVFSEMERKGFDKCVVAYSSMIVMYGRTGRVREAMRLVAKMKERRCEPNVWVYNSLIDMHGRANDLRLVEKLWKEMKRRKIMPDKVTYTNIISAYCRAREFETCIQFYKEYRINGGVLDKAMAGIMVGVFSNVGQIDELVKLLHDMKTEATSIDERLYRSALNAFTEAGLQMQARWLQESFQIL